MDYQRKRNLLTLTEILCFIVLIAPVSGGTITSFPTKQGLLNGSLSITCSYDLPSGETLDSVIFYRQKSGSGYENIVKFTGTGNNLYTEGIDLDNRSNLSLENNVATLAITSVKCVDEGQYRCELNYRSGNIIAKDERIMPSGLTVQGGPKKPSQLNQSPSDAAAEYESVTFTCVAEVGKSPTGAIKWEKIMPDNSIEIISETATNVESETKDSCTKTITSTLVLNVTRDDNEKKIRCSTTHPGLQDPNHFLITDSLNVNYPVSEPSAIQTPTKPSHTEGDRVVLKCTANSKPAPTYKWHHIDANITFDANSNGEKVFSKIQLTDTGTYRCDAVNTYQNKTFTASSNIVFVQVVEQTTPSPTSSPGSSTYKPGGVTESSTDGNDSNEELIIVIVCVVVGLAIIAAIILFIICRRKRQEKIKSQKIETPSEKPYNNNPAINGYSSRQPDLVSDEKKLYSNQQLHPYNNPNSSFNNNPYDNNPNTSFDKRSEDFSSYGDINFDDRPRSRKPVALSDADYADISMPRV